MKPALRETDILTLHGELVSVDDIPPAAVVVPVSGGKDSQACLKLAVETFGPDRVIGLFNNTQWEHPLTYDHISKIAKLYGVSIYACTSGSVEDEVINRGNFPMVLSRFCTKNLKVRPAKRFYDALSRRFAFEVWLGMRSDESTARRDRYAKIIDDEKYTLNEISTEFPQYLGKRGVRARLPVLSWTYSEIMEYLDGEENPLYAAGFDRVGCFPCLISTEKKHRNCFEYDQFGANQKRRVIELESLVSQKHEPANTDQLCMFCHI